MAISAKDRPIPITHFVQASGEAAKIWFGSAWFGTRAVTGVWAQRFDGALPEDPILGDAEHLPCASESGMRGSIWSSIVRLAQLIVSVIIYMHSYQYSFGTREV